GSMFAISGIAAALFLGGWNTGLLNVELSDRRYLGPVLGNVINGLVFVAKCWGGVFVMMWIRWTLPRLRIDQVMMTCLKYLLPISCVLMLGVSAWHVVWPALGLGFVVDHFHWLMFGVCAVLFLLIVKKLLTWSSPPPG